MGPKLRWVLALSIFVLVSIFLYYEMGLQVSPSVMTHQLMRDFKVQALGLGVLSSFYFYSYTLMQIPAGLLFDRMSKRILIPCAIAVCALGAFFFGSTETLLWASIGRFLMGIGSSFAFISVLVVSARWFPPRIFAFLVGVAQFLAAMGAMGGELPLSYAVNHFGWRSTINFLAWVGLGLAVLCFIVIRRNPEHHKMIKAQPISVKEGIGTIIRDKQNWFLGVYAFCHWGPVVAFAALWGIPFMMRLYSVSNAASAGMIAMIWIGIAVASPILGWLSDFIGRRLIIMWICGLIGVVSSLLAIYATLPVWVMFICLFFFGVASAAQILSFAVAKDINKPIVTGTAMGFTNMAVVAGGATLQPLIGYLLSKSWSGDILKGVPIYHLHDYRFSLLIVPVLFFVGFIVSAFLMKETYCQQQ